MVVSFSTDRFPQTPDSHQEPDVLQKDIFYLDPLFFKNEGVISFETAPGIWFSLQLNPPGNKESEALSYTAILSTGSKVLLPVYGDKDYTFDFYESQIKGIVTSKGEILLHNDSGFKLTNHQEAKKETKILTPEAPGMDGYFEGKIKGFPFAAFTLRECGKGKYPNINEDSIAINPENGTVALGDGLGGCEYSAYISRIAASSFAQVPGILHYKISQTGLAVQNFQRYQLYPKAKDPQEQKYRGDTTLVGLQIDGDTLETMSLGDSGWCLVRNGNIIAHSKEHTLPAEKYYQGEINEEEKWTAQDAYAVTATLNRPHSTKSTMYLIPRKDEHGKQIGWKESTDPIKLEKGDRLYAFTDGANGLTHEDFVAVSHLHPKKAAMELKKLAEEGNIQGIYKRKLKNGKEIILNSPRDNITLFVYAHEDDQEIARDQEIVRRESKHAFQKWITSLQLEKKHEFLKIPRV